MIFHNIAVFLCIVDKKKKNDCPLFISFTASPLYEDFLGIICHNWLYFAILTYIN